jgi:hypothetical protein
MPLCLHSQLFSAIKLKFQAKQKNEIKIIKSSNKNTEGLPKRSIASLFDNNLHQKRITKYKTPQTNIS